MSWREAAAGAGVAGYGLVATAVSVPVPDTPLGQSFHETATALQEAAEKDTEARERHDRVAEETEGIKEPEYSDVREAEDDDGADLTDHSDDGADLSADGPDVASPDGDPGPGSGM